MKVHEHEDSKEGHRIFVIPAEAEDFNEQYGDDEEKLRIRAKREDKEQAR